MLLLLMMMVVMMIMVVALTPTSRRTQLGTSSVFTGQISFLRLGTATSRR